MADSKVTIKIDADASGAKRGFAEVEAAANSAMDAGAQSAQRLSKSLDGVSDSARISARELKTVAAGMASMAAGLASSAMKAYGLGTEASYLGAASRGGVQGATMMAPLGPGAMIAGAAGGALIGAAQNYFDREAQGKEQAAAAVELAESLAKARDEMERTYGRTEAFAGILRRLGDESMSAADREQWRTDEIAERKREEEEASEKMVAAENAMKSFSRTISGPMTEDQARYFARLKEDWAAANKELATARGERKALEGAKPEPEKPQTPNDRVSGEFTSLEKLGIGFNAAADSLAREGNKIAEEQLAVLHQIANVAGNGVVFA